MFLPLQTCEWALRNFRYIGKYLIVLSTILQLESGKGHNIDFDPSLTILQIYSQQQQLQFIFAFLTCQTSVCTAREPSAHSKIKSKEKLHNVCLKVVVFFRRECLVLNKNLRRDEKNEFKNVDFGLLEVHCVSIIVPPCYSDSFQYFVLIFLFLAQYAELKFLRAYLFDTLQEAFLRQLESQLFTRVYYSENKIRKYFQYIKLNMR